MRSKYGPLLVVTVFISRMSAITTNVSPMSSQRMQWDMTPESCDCIDGALCVGFLVVLHFHDSEYLRRVTCGFKGFNPMVCCNQIDIMGPPVTQNCRRRSLTPTPTPYHTPGIVYNVPPFKRENPRENPLSRDFVTARTYIHSDTNTNPDYMVATHRIPSPESSYNSASMNPDFGDHFLHRPPSFANWDDNNPALNFQPPSTRPPMHYPQYPFMPREPNSVTNIPDPNLYKPSKMYPEEKSTTNSDFHKPPVDFPQYPFMPPPEDSSHTNIPYPNLDKPSEIYPEEKPTTNSNFHKPPVNFPQYHPFMPTSEDSSHTNIPDPNLYKPSEIYPEEKPTMNSDSHKPPVDFPQYHPLMPPPEDSSHTNIPDPNLMKPSEIYPEAKPTMNGIPHVHSVFPWIIPNLVNNITYHESHIPEFTPRSRDQHAKMLKRKLLPQLDCGVPPGERIVGGKSATLGEYPWIARIGYFRSGFRSDVYRCGGSLINHRYVITAAHCVANLPGGLELSSVRLGELDERTDPDCYQTECADPVQDYFSVEVKVHPDYDKPRFRNDVALIRLDRPVNYTNYISPICLPFDSLRKKSYIGLKSDIAGWGATDLGGSSSSPVLQWTRVTLIPRDVCTRIFAERTGTRLGTGQICAGGDKGQDSCEGDSGGPLMRGEQLGLDDFTRYYLLGVVSFGAKRCGSENLPGVYTEIPEYLDWILENIDP